MDNAETDMVGINEITRATTAKNLGIVSSIRIISRVLTLLSTIILARLLTPEDYGIVGISSFLVILVLTFQDFGIGQAVIYQKSEISIMLFTGFTIRFFFSLILDLILRIVNAFCIATSPL